jgi:hypothetical protein
MVSTLVDLSLNENRVMPNPVCAKLFSAALASAMQEGGFSQMRLALVPTPSATTEHNNYSNDGLRTMAAGSPNK